MGSCLSKTEDDDDVLKLLLLGVGGSGKSTLFKQLKITGYADSLDDETRNEAAPFIRENCTKACVILVRLCEQLEITLPDDVLDHAEAIEEVTNAGDISSEELSKIQNACEAIWACPEIKDAVELSFKQHQERLQLQTNDPYFLNCLDKIFAEDYLPSDEDMLKMRRATSGSNEINFKYEGNEWNIVDVGGQVHERHSWTEKADDLSGLVYIISLSDYDQYSQDTRQVNKFIDDSIGSMLKVMNLEQIQDIPVVILLNKKDIFKKKISMGTNIKGAFPSYSGSEDDWYESLEYIKGYIKKEIKKEVKHNTAVELLVTTATDQELMKTMIQEIIHAISLTNFQQSGMFDKN